MTNPPERPPFDPLAGRPLIAAASVVRRLGDIAVQAMATGWIAFMTQPAPVTGFVLAIVTEIGTILLRMLSLRVRMVVIALATSSVVIGLTFYLDGRGGKPPGDLVQISMRSADSYCANKLDRQCIDCAFISTSAPTRMTSPMSDCNADRPAGRR